MGKARRRWTEEQLAEALRQNGELSLEVGGDVPAKSPSAAVSLPKASGLADRVLAAILDAGLPEPEPELVFHPTRNWRLDFVWRDYMVAVEVEGGIWMQTETGRSKGHAHPVRFLKDCEKYNEAAIYGWLLLRITQEHLASGEATGWIRRALESRGYKHDG